MSNIVLCLHCNKHKLRSDFYKSVIHKNKNTAGRCKECGRNKYKNKHIPNEIDLKGDLFILRNNKDKLNKKISEIDIDIKNICKQLYGKCDINYLNKQANKTNEQKKIKNDRAKKYYYQNKEKVVMNNRISNLAKRHNLTIYELYQRVPRDELLDFYNNNNKCQYCQKEIKSNKGKTIDHIIPLSTSNKFELDNLVICCRECNSKKHKKNLLVFIKECDIIIPKDILRRYYEMIKLLNV